MVMVRVSLSCSQSVVLDQSVASRRLLLVRDVYRHIVS